MEKLSKTHIAQRRQKVYLYVETKLEVVTYAVKTFFNRRNGCVRLVIRLVLCSDFRRLTTASFATRLAAEFSPASGHVFGHSQGETDVSSYRCIPQNFESASIENVSSGLRTRDKTSIFKSGQDLD